MQQLDGLRCSVCNGTQFDFTDETNIACRACRTVITDHALNAQLENNFQGGRYATKVAAKAAVHKEKDGKVSATVNNFAMFEGTKSLAGLTTQH